jgi:hypothetical protein
MQFSIRAYLSPFDALNACSGQAFSLLTGRAGAHPSTSVGVGQHHIHPAPTPIHGVVLDQTLIVQFHRFYEIHLVAVRLLTGIFPDQLFAVREIPLSIILSEAGFPPSDFSENDFRARQDSNL